MLNEECQRNWGEVMQHAINKVARNSIFIFLARITDLIIVTILVSLAAHYLGLKVFGEYAFVRAIAFVLSPVIAFGSIRILIREMSVEKENTSLFLSSGLALNGLMTIVVGIITTIIAFNFHLGSTSIIALYLAVLAQVLMVMQNTACSVFVAYEKMVYDLLTTFVTHLSTLLFFLIVIFFDFGIIGLLIASVVGNGAGLFLTFLILAHKFALPKVDINFRHQIYLLKEAFPIGISTFLSQGYTYFNVFLLKLFRDISQVSFFQAPQRVIAPILLIPNSFLFAFVPTLSRLASDETLNSNLQYAYNKTLKYILILSLPVSIILTMYASKVVLLFFGREFLEATASFQILIWTIVPLFANSLLSFILTSIKKQKVLPISTLACFITNCLLGFLLVEKYGHVGASIASLISSGVLFMINFYYVSKYLGFIPVHRIAPRLLFAGVTMYLFLLGLVGIFNMVTVSISAFLIYFGILYLSRTFTSDEIEIFKSAIPMNLKKGQKQK